MKRVIIAILAVAMFIPAFAGKKADKKTLTWQYEAEDLGKVAKDQKSVIFKIWSFDKNEKKAMSMAKKNAIHAVIFKQIGRNPALANSPSIADEHKQFFEDFFADGGAYSAYVSLSNNGAIQPGDKQKTKEGWKIGIKVTVDRAGLRKYLEEKGIIVAMDSLF